MDWRQRRKRDAELLAQHKFELKQTRAHNRRLAEELAAKRRYEAAKKPPPRAQEDRFCKNLDCHTRVKGTTYCSDHCRTHHRAKRTEARTRMVEVYRDAIESGWYQIPEAEVLADAIMETATVVNLRHPDGGETRGKMRFKATDYMRSREWAEHVLAKLRQAGKIPE